MADRMCPNVECEKHRHPTRLMGACDCGAAFVPFKTEEQEVGEALWDLASPTMKRLVTYSMLGREFDRRTRVEDSSTQEER